MKPFLPLEDFFRNSERTGYQLSPDGKYISYMAPYEDRLNVLYAPSAKPTNKHYALHTKLNVA